MKLTWVIFIFSVVVSNSEYTFYEFINRKLITSCFYNQLIFMSKLPNKQAVNLYL